ncbi:MAG: hypothetical protein HY731_13140, partial [Candidatus Tectomicrobia bacterium]|nr:hypothetical protein [Candidatus Tectomicrobia bacterium]
LATAVAIAPSPLAVLNLQTLENQGNPRRCLLHLVKDADPAQAQATSTALAIRVANDPIARSLRDAGPFGDGFLIPLTLHRDLGYGWIYLEGSNRDVLILQSLSLLATHASNALYSSVAQAMLAERERPFYESLIV